MVRQLLKKYQSNFFTSNTKKYPFHVDGYKNREVALLTQHGKERVLAPILKEFIGCTVSKVEGYDTDLLGTDPYTGIFFTNFEVLIWVDDASDLEIIGCEKLQD